MSTMILPITSRPNQSFQITLDVDEKNLELSFFLRYNELAKYWLLDIDDGKTGNPLIACLPLVPGDDPAGNLLHQFQHLEIGSLFLLKSGVTEEEYPGEQTIGTDWTIVWSDTR